MSKSIILTGGCGFIGHHFAEYVHKNTDWNIIIIDKLSYASMGLNRLRNNELLYSKRVKVFTIDLCNEISDGVKKEIGENVNYIVHMAAETHVDNSIKEPLKIITNNVNSTVKFFINDGNWWTCVIIDRLISCIDSIFN